MPDLELKSAFELRQRRYRQAALLLTKWAHEDHAYDERVGDALERELNDDAICGSHFNGHDITRKSLSIRDAMDQL